MRLQGCGWWGAAAGTHGRPTGAQRAVPTGRNAADDGVCSAVAFLGDRRCVRLRDCSDHGGGRQDDTFPER